MHFATTLIVAAAAAGVSAHPSGHVHGHRAFHSKKAQISEREPKEIETTALIDGKLVPIKFSMDTKPEAPAVPSPVVAAVKAPEPSKEAPKETKPAASSGSGKSGKGVTSYEPFCSGGGAAKREDYSQTSKENIAYKGNTGQNGNCAYGSNWKLVANEKVMESYKYGIKVTGGSKTLNCGIWNKISAKGGIDGFWPANWVSSFTVGANEEQWIAADKNTQGGIMCTHEDKVPVRESDGYPKVTWTEVDFESEPNKGACGWDASGIAPGKSGYACNGLKLCAIKLPFDGAVKEDRRCSTIAAGMGCQATNAYNQIDEWKGGIGGDVLAFDKGHLWLHADYS